MLNLDDFTESPTLCPAPWTQVAIDTNQNLRPCCFIESDIQSWSDFNTYWNSTQVQEIRKAMLKGKWHSACKKCQSIEEHGGLSKRYYETYTLKKRLRNPASLKIDASPISTDPALCLEVRFGNLCNLQCRMCNPDSSNKIAAEYNKLAKNFEQELFPKTEAPLIQRTLDDLRAQLPPLQTLQVVRILGGEPFLDNECKSFCQLLVDQNISSNISLIITTNLTFINREWIEILKNFKHITLQLSVDSTEKVLEYIRYGASWSEIKRNLNLYLSKLSNVRFIFVPCVQAYNVSSLYKVYSLCQHLKTKHPEHDISIFPNMLKSPQFLATNILPREIRQLATKRLSEFLKNNTFYQAEKEHLNSIISNISKQELAPLKLRDMWRRYTIALDKHRDQSIEDSIPELASLI